MPRLEQVGLIGNGQFAAHVAADGEVVWCCLPRFDAEPILAGLLDPARGGTFLVGPAAGGDGRQRYLPNTNVLGHRVRGRRSGAFRVVDFAPRFEQHQRAFHPTQLFRVVEPLRGRAAGPGPLPAGARLVGAPAGAGRRARTTSASRATRPQLRLTTDVPLAYLAGQPFTLTGRRHLAL